jgi:hypothetical protein
MTICPSTWQSQNKLLDILIERKIFSELEGGFMFDGNLRVEEEF